MDSRSCPANKLFAFLALTLVLWCSPGGEARAEKTSNHVLFDGTQYALRVTIVDSEIPGPTVMIQGGIQGDEASGYLSAQLLANAKVKKGRLIVVPRANPPTVLACRRQINVDLNRRFDRDYNEYFEDYLARAIQVLLSQADAVIHLHEGSGFYHPKPIDALRGPRRFGQSVIIDAAVGPKGQPLGKTVSETLKRFNPTLPPEFAFHLFDMDTLNPRSAWGEQRKSLTYNALTRLGIPALAVEVSKNIPDLAAKASMQTRLSAALAQSFGVEVELPDVSPQAVRGLLQRSALVLLNGAPLTPAGATVPPGQDLRFTVSEAKGLDFQPGIVSPDRPLFNLALAPRQASLPVTAVDIRADGVTLARAPLKVQPKAQAQAQPGGERFVFYVDGGKRVLSEGETLSVFEGQSLVIDGMEDAPREVLNLLGYVGPDGSNQDAGHEIIVDPSAWKSNYLTTLSSGAVVTRILRETPGKPKIGVNVLISPRDAPSLFVRQRESNRLTELELGSTGTLSPGTYELAEIPPGFVVLSGGLPVDLTRRLTIGPTEPLKLEVRLATTFKRIGSLERGAQP